MAIMIDFASNADDINDSLTNLNATVQKAETEEQKMAALRAKTTAEIVKQTKAIKDYDSAQSKAIRSGNSGSFINSGGIANSTRSAFSNMGSRIGSLGSAAGGAYASAKQSEIFRAARHLPGVGHVLKEVDHIAAFGKAILPLAPLALAVGIAFHGLSEIIHKHKEIEEARLKGFAEFAKTMDDANAATQKFNEGVTKTRGERGISAAHQRGNEIRQAFFLGQGVKGESSVMRDMNSYAEKSGLPGAREAFVAAQRLDNSSAALKIADLVGRTGLANPNEVIGHLNNDRIAAATDKFGTTDIVKVAMEEIQKLAPGRNITREMVEGKRSNRYIDNLDAVNKNDEKGVSQDIGLIGEAGNYSKRLYEEATKQITYLDAQAERDKAANELRLKVYNENQKQVAELQKMVKHQSAMGAWFRDTWLHMGFLDPSAKAQIKRANDKMIAEENAIDSTEVNP